MFQAGIVVVFGYKLLSSVDLRKRLVMIFLPPIREEKYFNTIFIYLSFARMVSNEM